MRINLAATLAAALVSAGAAQAQTTPTRDPAEVRPGAYTVEPEHTQVTWTLSHLGFTNFSGRFSNVSGSLTLTPRNPLSSQFEISIPTDTVDTPSEKLNGELKGADWLDTTRYPTATYKSSKIELTGHGQARVSGALTLHGVTHPLVLDVHFNAAGINPIDHHYTVGFSASGTIHRRDYGVTKYDPIVGDDVTLTISAPFEQAAAHQ